MEKTEPTTMNISNENVSALRNILETTQPINKVDFLKLSEYRDNFNGDRLYNKNCM